jgi:hypothetical protein
MVRTGESTRDLYRQAGKRLAALNLPRVFTLAQLQQAVERDRGQPVRLIPRDLPVLAPHGLWIAGEHADYVFFDRAAGQIRQHQIVGHEFGHMLFDDDTVPAHPPELAAMIGPGPPPETVRMLQRRIGYTDLVERRAEVFGTVAIQHIDLWAPPPDAWATDPELLARLSATLVPDERPC